MQRVPTLKERIGSLFGDATTADVTFVVGEERERIPAHAAVVSTASDSFKAMFFGDFNRERVIEVPDASPDGFRTMLRYIYTDEFDISEGNVEAVVRVADKYLLVGLFAECVDWMKRNATPANACRFLPLGELYTDIGKVCRTLALRRGNEALKSEAFLSLPKDLLAKMFASDNLAADEVTVYGRAVDWAKRQLETKDRRDDPAVVRATLGSLLYLIRFPLFTAEEFAKGPSESGILSAEECVSVFQWFTVKKQPALFSVSARATALVGIQELVKQFGLTHRDECEHEAGVKVDVAQLRKLCETSRVSCRHIYPWICLTCNKAFCADRKSCGFHHHSQQAQHALHFGACSKHIFCGKCDKLIAWVSYD